MWTPRGVGGCRTHLLHGMQTLQTEVLPDEGETIKTIMRAFVTQSVPEVQSEIQPARSPRSTCTRFGNYALGPIKTCLVASIRGEESSSTLH